MPSTNTMLGLAAGAAGAIGLKVLDQQTNISADLSILPKFVKLLKLYSLAKKEGSIADLWTDSAKKWPDNTFVIFENARLTYSDMEMLSNQCAGWLQGQGFKRDDVLSLFMENKADFIALWLAMAKIGAQAALINCNIMQTALVHCIKVASSTAVVFDFETAEAVRAVQGSLSGLRFIHWGSKAGGDWSVAPLVVTHEALLGMDRDGEKFKSCRQGMQMSENFGFIYTSGTTGLPKAAKISHVKFAGGCALYQFAGMGPADKVYNCLPLYHAVGGCLVVSGCFMTGAAMVLAKKFSPSRFWLDVTAYRCTGFQYVGELGRYLVNHAKAHPEVLKLQHHLKFACGNGLRPEIWDDFQDGFRIPLVLEYYGATEGNGAMINWCSRSDKGSRGAVGRMGALLKGAMKQKIVKYNVETEEVVRGPDGFCIECGYNEPGELLIFNDTDHPAKTFRGYTDEKATEKKLLRNVFKKGDCYFRSGDLLSTDSRGYYYFIDRIGDTFRWKGENCSTMEISEIISTLPGVEEANVYGVKVPGADDGRGCMVALKGASDELKSPQKLDELQKLCEKELPAYSWPLFIRILEQVEVTSTFKHNKVHLREQGCDPKQIQEPLFWLDPRTRRYTRFGEEEYQLLLKGQSRL